MEVVIFLAMMIVPVLSIISLVMCIAQRKQITALKAFTQKLLETSTVTSDPRAYQKMQLDMI